MVFEDRRDAGRRLAATLRPLATERPVIVALPRGGVPIGDEVARRLGAPLEVLAVRKLGAPGNPELAIGAVAEGGTGVVDQAAARRVGLIDEVLQETLDREFKELRRRVARYRAGRDRIAVAGRTVIVVDDGLATGLTDLAAVHALRDQAAQQIIVAVPVASPDALHLLADEADDVACLTVPDQLGAVGLWYRDFSAVSDGEVLAALAPHHPRPASRGVSP
ncbi:MAG: phosphoribosyltransferase [Solirubrobacterales bacterium]|nr:phosphoribosyltransferase [Solirubrobacterales bacterium]